MKELLYILKLHYVINHAIFDFFHFLNNMSGQNLFKKVKLQTFGKGGSTLQTHIVSFLRNTLYIVWPKGELICRVMTSQLYKGIQIIIHASREETKERNINVPINRYNAWILKPEAISYTTIFK
jgi:hypothetical protein